MAGNQVLEWFDIDSEIKTANLKDVRFNILYNLQTYDTNASLAGPISSPRLVST